MSGSMRSGPDTALRSWSGTVISGTPPKYSKARSVEAMNTLRSCERIPHALWAKLQPLLPVPEDKLGASRTGP